MGCSITTFIKFSYDCRIRTVKPSVLGWCSDGIRRRWTRTVEVRKSSVWSLSGREDRQQTVSCLKIWTEYRQQTESRQINKTDTSYHFSENPDRIQTVDRIDTKRIRTDRNLPENPGSRQTPDRIVRNKNETRTGLGQHCPPTTGWYHSIRFDEQIRFYSSDNLIVDFKLN